MKADLFSFNGVLSGYAKLGNFSAAMAVKNRMWSSGIKPNVVSYTTLLHTCAYARPKRRAEAEQRIRKAAAEPFRVGADLVVRVDLERTACRHAQQVKYKGHILREHARRGLPL